MSIQLTKSERDKIFWDRLLDGVVLNPIPHRKKAVGGNYRRYNAPKRHFNREKKPESHFERKQEKEDSWVWPEPMKVDQ